ncbi:MAG: ferredoxin:thioredoxin reductase [Thermodesulfovibrio sp.]|nr:ferredoxin:thioredoxin reductase [Thermodesulfovibrio sp.]
MTPEQLFDLLTTYAHSQGMELNRDKTFVLDILDGLLRNEARYGYRSCPCRLASGVGEMDADIVCPCAYRNADVSEFGSCYCGLYVSAEWNEEKIAHITVPERRVKKEVTNGHS